MRKHIINISITILSILSVLVAAKYTLINVIAYNPPTIASQYKKEAHKAKKDSRFVIYNVVSSISGMDHWKTHMGKSLRERVAPYGGNVLHKVKMATFVADHWGVVINSMNYDIDLYVFEINAFLFNERKSIFTASDPQNTLRYPENIRAILSNGSLSTKYKIWLQYGIETWLSETLKTYYNPYFMGTSLQEERRSYHKKILKRIKPWIRPMSSQMEIYKNNFIFKDYNNGIDTDVLHDFMNWLPDKSHPSIPIMIYFPPLNVPLLKEASGLEAWERFRNFRAELAVKCQNDNIPFLDLTEFFGNDNHMFMDYGHFLVSEKGKRAFDKTANALFEYLKVRQPLAGFIQPSAKNQYESKNNSSLN